MTLELMNQMAKRGLYSPLNYYLGLLDLLKQGMDFEAVMNDVPESILGPILDIAARHHEAPDRSVDLKEAEIVDNIAAWGRLHAAEPLSKATIGTRP